MGMSVRVVGLSLVALCAAIACGGAVLPPAPVTDAGTVDAGMPDAGWVRSGTITLTLGTWNIERFPKTATTSRAVKEVLATLDADLVGIQEIIDPLAFVALHESLPEWGGLRVREPYDFLAVGLLYRKAKIRIVESEPIFTDDGFAFPRPPLWAKVEALDDEGRVAFDFELLVVHLKALGDVRSRSRRARACARLETWIRTRQMQGGEQDFIVVGDWNDKLDDVPEDNVFLPFLLSPERYQFLTQPLADARDSSYIPFPGLIDHIMVTTDALDEYGPGSTRVVYAEQDYIGYLPNVSDHRPVLSTFIVR